MYKIDDYITDIELLSQFSQTEKEMFEFLMDSIPETMLFIKPDKSSSGGYIDYKEVIISTEYDDTSYEENKPLITLLIVLAKVLGNSRELILNIEKAQDLPSLIYDILDTTKDHLKKNNLTLLTAKASDIGFDIDFNKLSREMPEYLKEIESYFGFILHKYETTRNRGSNSALYQILRDYDRIDPALSFATLEILEPGDTDEIAIELGLIGEGGLPDKRTVKAGVVRSHLSTLDSYYADTDLAEVNFDTTFDYRNNYYFLNPKSLLYKLIMQVKPAGIFYELVVKASAYLIISVGRGFADNKSLIVQDENERSGFREIKEIKLSGEKVSLDYTDTIDSVTGIKIEFETTSNIDFDVETNVVINLKDDDPEVISNNKTNKPKGTLYKDTINIDKEADDIEDMEISIQVSDKFDTSNKEEITAVKELPEVVSLSKIGVSEDSETFNEPIQKTETTIEIENEHKTMPIKRVYGYFTRKDYFNPVPTSSELIDKVDVLQGSSVSDKIVNNTDKAFHGTYQLSYYFERDDVKGDKISRTLVTEPIPIKIKDKYGREHFQLLLSGISINSEYRVVATITNPNNFSAIVKIKPEWQYQGSGGTWVKDTTANNTIITKTINAESSIVETIDIRTDEDTYADTNRHLAKRLSLLVSSTTAEISSVDYVDSKLTLSKQPILGLSIGDEPYPYLVPKYETVDGVLVRQVNFSPNQGYVWHGIAGITSMIYIDGLDISGIVSLEDTVFTQTIDRQGQPIEKLYTGFEDTGKTITIADETDVVQYSNSGEESLIEFIPYPAYYESFTVSTKLSIAVGQHVNPVYYSNVHNEEYEDIDVVVLKVPKILISEVYVDRPISSMPTLKITLQNTFNEALNARVKYRVLDDGELNEKVFTINANSIETFTLHTFVLEEMLGSGDVITHKDIILASNYVQADFTRDKSFSRITENTSAIGWKYENLLPPIIEEVSRTSTDITVKISNNNPRVVWYGGLFDWIDANSYTTLVFSRKTYDYDIEIFFHTSSEPLLANGFSTIANASTTTYFRIDKQ